MYAKDRTSEDALDPSTIVRCGYITTWTRRVSIKWYLEGSDSSGGACPFPPTQGLWMMIFAPKEVRSFGRGLTPIRSGEEWLRCGCGFHQTLRGMRESPRRPFPGKVCPLHGRQCPLLTSPHPPNDGISHLSALLVSSVKVSSW